MSYEGMVVKVGQVWRHHLYLDREYKIVEIVPNRYHAGLWDVNAELYIGGDFYAMSAFATLNSDFSPRNWDPGWYCNNLDIKVFTRISKRTLQKREREQLAGNILVGKS